MFQDDLLKWYEQNARTLPFRQQKDAYGIWISEIMAQQTRIEAMLPYYNRFILELPNIEALSKCDDEKLIKLWQGLGYYSRARNLKKCALYCMEQYNGHLPQTKEELMKCPGIGPYTAGAIASIAFDQRVSAIDGNVLRVFSRLYGIDEVLNSKIKKKIEKLVDVSLPDSSKISHYNQALMELGALICIPKHPRCDMCPIQMDCIAYKKGIQNQLPLLPEKKKRRIEQKTIFIYVYQDKIHLKKREEKGLLAGLYGFDEEKKDCLCQIPLQDYIHIFSHVEWHMKAFVCLVEKEGDSFYSIEDIEKYYAIPSAFEPFYNQVKNMIKGEVL
ncbi:A/G-specific adenine glycosylase [Floccifex sp.]|uniref:A/G-specific adenine glycosylase n=1 Tax=Floccifex sp. TaxID=2815810 RepID=UPI003EFECB42